MELTPLPREEEDLLRRAIGLRCQRAREQLALSQRALARIMNKSPSWVREIETGQQYAPPYLVRALSRAIGVSAGWFYGEDAFAPSVLMNELRRLTEAVTNGRGPAST